MYTKENIQSLIIDLKGYETTYDVLIDFLEELLKKGLFDFGLSKPGSQSSAFVLKEMGEVFPDILSILFLPKEDLSLFINSSPDIIQEHAIACWRLRIDK